MIAAATIGNGDTGGKPAEGWWFFRVPDCVRPLLARAGGKAALVYLSLASHANNEWQSWPAVSTIVNETGLTERAVRYNLRRLEEVHAIIKDTHTRRTTTYTLSTGARICPPTNKREERICRVGGTDLPGRGHGFAPQRGTDLPPNYTSEQKPRTKPQNKIQRGKAAGVVVPPELCADEFEKEWESWLGYRRKRRLSMLAETLQGQLAKLARLGPTAAAAEIRNSITAGYQSVCYDRGSSDGRQKQRMLTSAGQRHPSSPGSAEGVF